MKNINLQLYDGLKEEIRDSKSKIIILKEGDIIRFTIDEVKTLMTILQNDPGYLRGTLVIAKEVNKSMAALAVLGNIKEIYADMISEHAVKLLDSYHIKFKYRQTIPFFESKTKAGFDPIELLAIPCEYPTEIYIKLDGLFSKIPSDIKGWSKIFR
ncbi:MAG: DUF1893 domain-containing protein [Muribaculaceae bacterium]|nr:DUF1893 domain-containing protein [Muribaculaceae bacterium]